MSLPSSYFGWSPFFSRNFRNNILLKWILKNHKMNSDLSQTYISQWFHWNKAPQELSWSKNPGKCRLGQTKNFRQKRMNMKHEFEVWLLAAEQKGSQMEIEINLVLLFSCCWCWCLKTFQYFTYLSKILWFLIPRPELSTSWGDLGCGYDLPRYMILNKNINAFETARVFPTFLGVNYRRGRVKS